jgi:hypothetical protein
MSSYNPSIHGNVAANLRRMYLATYGKDCPLSDHTIYIIHLEWAQTDDDDRDASAVREMHDLASRSTRDAQRPIIPGVVIKDNRR